VPTSPQGGSEVFWEIRPVTEFHFPTTHPDRPAPFCSRPKRPEKEVGGGVSGHIPDARSVVYRIKPRVLSHRTTSSEAKPSECQRAARSGGRAMMKSIFEAYANVYNAVTLHRPNPAAYGRPGPAPVPKRRFWSRRKPSDE
jgi:hypothetical protein